MKNALCLFQLSPWVRGFGHRGVLISRGSDPEYWRQEYGQWLPMTIGRRVELKMPFASVFAIKVSIAARLYIYVLAQLSPLD